MRDKISVKELQKLLDEKKPVFILDVRPQEQREEWHIAGSVHKDAYGQLNKGDESVLDDLSIPENIPVITVCAAGRTSQLAADVLKKKGHKAYSLEGGMKGWNYAWNIAELITPGLDAKIIQVRRVAKGCLSYIIGSGEEAIVVDASLNPEVYQSIANRYNWKIRYVVDTHIHADYLSRTRGLAAASGADHLFYELAEVDYPFTPVKDGEKLKIGSVEIEILHTPGHTPESTSFLVGGKALLTGDTLFTDGVGRPDLKADHDETVRKAVRLYESLQRILELSKDTVILPAHISHAILFDGKMIMDTLTGIRDKLELLNLPKQQFIEASLKRIPPAPPNYLTITALNKGGDSAGYQAAELEAGANKCAIS